MKIFYDNMAYDKETEAFLAPDGCTYSEEPMTGWFIVDKLLPDNVYQDFIQFNKTKIDLLENAWSQLPEGLQDLFQNNYNRVKGYLILGDKAKALENILSTSVLMVTPEMQGAYTTLVNMIQEF